MQFLIFNRFEYDDGIIDEYAPCETLADLKEIETIACTLVVEQTKKYSFSSGIKTAAKRNADGSFVLDEQGEPIIEIVALKNFVVDTKEWKQWLKEGFDHYYEKAHFQEYVFFRKVYQDAFAVDVPSLEDLLYLLQRKGDCKNYVYSIGCNLPGYKLSDGSDFWFLVIE